MRHKAVVISASLFRRAFHSSSRRSPDALVITAADAGIIRRSGCQDGAKWTTCGDAFFNASRCRKAKSVTDAFAVAREASC